MMDVGKDLMAYFRELSPTDRRHKFEALVADGAIEDDVKEFCELLYNERYQDAKKGEQKVDNWLFKLVYLPGLYKKRRIFRRGFKREIEATLSELHLADADSLGEMESTILYLEYRNAAKRYLSTCDSVDYASTMFGLKKAGPEEKKYQACEDLWRASRGCATAAGEEERLRLWCNALHDELIQYDASLEKIYEEMDS